MASVILDCRHAHALLSRRLDARLRWHERLALGLHLLGCTACARVARQWAFLSRALRQLDARDDDTVSP